MNTFAMAWHRFWFAPVSPRLLGCCRFCFFAAFYGLYLHQVDLRDYALFPMVFTSRAVFRLAAVSAARLGCPQRLGQGVYARNPPRGAEAVYPRGYSQQLRAWSLRHRTPVQLRLPALGTCRGAYRHGCPGPVTLR